MSTLSVVEGHLFAIYQALATLRLTTVILNLMPFGYQVAAKKHLRKHLSPYF